MSKSASSGVGRRIQVRRSGIHGKGVYAVQDIPKGQTTHALDFADHRLRFYIDNLFTERLVAPYPLSPEEIKAVEKMLPLYSAQLLTYLKLGGYKLGLLLNFNTVHLRDGIRRVVN